MWMDTEERNLEAYRLTGEIVSMLRRAAKQQLNDSSGGAGISLEELPATVATRLIERQLYEQSVSMFEDEYYEVIDYATIPDLLEIFSNLSEVSQVLMRISSSRAMLFARFQELQAVEAKLATFRPVSDGDVKFVRNFHGRLSEAMGLPAKRRPQREEAARPVVDETAERRVAEEAVEAAAAEEAVEAAVAEESAPAKAPIPDPLSEVGEHGDETAVVSVIEIDSGAHARVVAQTDEPLAEPEEPEPEAVAAEAVASPPPEPAAATEAAEEQAAEPPPQAEPQPRSAPVRKATPGFGQRPASRPPMRSATVSRPASEQQARAEQDTDDLVVPEVVSSEALEEAIVDGNKVVVLRALQREIANLTEAVWNGRALPLPVVWHTVSRSDWYTENFVPLGLHALSDYFNLVNRASERQESGADMSELQSFLRNHNFTNTLMALRELFRRHSR